MSETLWRLSVFIGVLLVMVLWEFLAPKRKPRYSRKQRWPANLAIVAVDTLLLRVIAPVGLTGIALRASEQEWGLFHYLSSTAGNELPFWFVVLVSLVALDIVLYWQHRLFHRIPVLWRMHRVHHADPDFDVTTGLRFHPAEIVLSFFIKASAILVLGAPALAVIVFEIILNACSLFNHGNVALPTSLERAARKVLITQELHRIHHSVEKEETNSNYGFSVSWWDHLFGSFTSKPKAGSDQVDIGLKEYRDASITTKLWGLLKIPFRN
ncbi:sterol desaturase family protein [Idiomarina abyssalis]|uniref:Sterol desaturase family protein n=1 Tax=Idiomarina abyssalis TaxID=86102 RepID=A0A8I1KH02_9GAMM|nr:sterol desaturase family protein [Idiomarina abyssalis]MBJ7265416.1 sterol desaturase family protein [Idiomarina abyssalis]MBJ7274050.1 sterol desaturase family protein [Idiomarina abyssalis]MBJ7315240.1 sterol desaturase family protein [Idiomarina abyssalis]